MGGVSAQARQGRRSGAKRQRDRPTAKTFRTVWLICAPRTATVSSDLLVSSFKNEHGRYFSDARDTFELGENEVAKSLHVENPQTKDVIEVACY
jgi:hypothetical protein